MSISQYEHTGTEAIAQALSRILHENTTHEIQRGFNGRGLDIRMIYRGKKRKLLCHVTIGEVAVAEVGRQMEEAMEKFYGTLNQNAGGGEAITLTRDDLEAIPAAKKNAEKVIIKSISRDRDALIFLDDATMRTRIEEMLS